MDKDQTVPSRLMLEPIGFVRNTLATKVEAARQPQAAEGQAATIELLPGRNFEHALEDLARWKRIWVIFWFHHNSGWRPKVPCRECSGRNQRRVRPRAARHARDARTPHAVLPPPGTAL